MAQLVDRSDRGAAAVLTLDSPANRNALSKSLVETLQGQLDDVAVDRSVRCVVIGGTGSTFCSGADLSDPPVDEGPGSYTEVLRTLWYYPKPVVAAINGHVRAGGLGMVAAADISICVESASFAFTEVRIGVAPAIISVLCLRKMNPAASSRLLLTGERFGVEEARAAGLVGTVVAVDGLDDAVDEVTAQFRLCEPNALKVARDLMRRVPGMDVDAGLTYTQRVSREMFASPEAQEGIASFKQKRPPAWAI